MIFILNYIYREDFIVIACEVVGLLRGRSSDVWERMNVIKKCSVSHFQHIHQREEWLETASSTPLRLKWLFNIYQHSKRVKEVKDGEGSGSLLKPFRGGK